jgi:Flp pilus assembly protein TadG
MLKNILTFKKDQKGAVVVLVAVLLILFLGMAALAIDVYHLFVVRNELQNAADAGALAGAKVLYYNNTDNDPDNDPPSDELNFTINPNANTVAYNTAIENLSENVSVEVNDHASNAGDVQRGHWSFSANGGDGLFTPNDTLTTIDIGNFSKEELDVNNDFINAVRVVVRRQDKPASSFFAQIFGFENFGVVAEATAYIGFAGSINPGEIDQPIAICEESIVDEDGDYSCNMGRMLNSGSNLNTANTGGWTNFSQPCDTADASEMKSLICGDGNPEEMKFGVGIGAVGGVQDVVLNDLVDCWMATEAPSNKPPTHVWNMTLPVVKCPGNNVSNCPTLVGAVNVDVVWIIHKNDPKYDDVPREMEDWTCTDPDGFVCWKSFVDHFQLANVTGPPMSDEDYEEMYQKKTYSFSRPVNPLSLRG